MEGKVFETLYLTKTQILAYAKQNEVKEFLDALIDCAKKTAEHEIIPGSQGFRMYTENFIDQIEFFAIIFQTQQNEDMEVYVFEANLYNAYLLNDRGGTIEKVI